MPNSRSTTPPKHKQAAIVTSPYFKAKLIQSPYFGGASGREEKVREDGFLPYNTYLRAAHARPKLIQGNTFSCFYTFYIYTDASARGGFWRLVEGIGLSLFYLVPPVC